MIRELAKELGVTEHALFGAIYRACRELGIDPAKSVTYGMGRDFYDLEGDVMIESHPVEWSVLMVVGRTSQIHIRRELSERDLDETVFVIDHKEAAAMREP